MVLVDEFSSAAALHGGGVAITVASRSIGRLKMEIDVFP